MDMNIGNELKKIGLKAAYNYLDKDPGANMPRLMEWFDKVVKEDVLVKQREVFRNIIADKDSNWYQLLCSLWMDIDDEVRKTLFENLVINANALAVLRARESEAKYHCNVPWVVDFDLGITEGNRYLSFDDLDRLIEEAKALGTYMFLLTGKEPLCRKEEVIALCNKHTECQFMVFTDGMKIDEDFADQALRVKNLITAVRVRGRDGDQALADVFAVLKAKKLPYGVYGVYDKETAGDFDREVFFDDVISWGAKFCWFFSSLSEAADTVYERVKQYRESKPLLAINFCKDRAITGGCMAGRYYCHVDPEGMIRPCSVLQCAAVDSQEKSLLQAYQSEWFQRGWGKGCLT